ncbi:hypothetical protein ACIGO7_07685 [Streptomyces virginiae]|uniref:hypothetical protein n=1 Tax=Streptomyces virginiae TaxID=1961 RepID=UPI00344F1019
MTENVLLASHMEAAALKQAELAQRLNKHIERLTGRPGTLQDRHIRNWLTGKTSWPQTRQRLALEAEFGVSADALGFRRPVRHGSGEHPAPSHAPSEDPVKRRRFTSAAVGFTVSALLPVPAATSRRRIGMADLDELETAFDQLITSDNLAGGTVRLETRALAFAHHAQERLAVGTMSERVKDRLYLLAAAFTGTALWAAVDDHAPDRARGHLERALHMARLSKNPEIELRLWGHAALLASQRPGGLREALDAAQIARRSAACRRDPLFSSFASARLAGVQAQAGDHNGSLRSMEIARKAFQKADPGAQRPAWIGFYDAAELDGLSAVVMSRIGRHAEAEAHLHRTLGGLRPGYVRNRRYYTASLALAQLHQREPEQACATALSALPDQASDSLTGRTGLLLDRFDKGLTSMAPGAQCTSEWTARYVTNKGQQS